MGLFSSKEKWMTEDEKKKNKAISSLKKAGWVELLNAASNAPLKEVADAAAVRLLGMIEDSDSPNHLGRDDLKTIAAKGREDIAVAACKKLIWYSEDDVYVATHTPYPTVAEYVVDKLDDKMFQTGLKEIVLSKTGHDSAKLLAVRRMQGRGAIEAVAQSDVTEELRKEAERKLKIIQEAEDPETSPGKLSELGHHEISAVRQAVAGNPSTPPAILKELIKEKRLSWISHAAAANPSTPPEALAQAYDEGGWGDSTTRFCLAGNPSTPKETLVVLANDEEKYIRDLVMENPNYR